MPKPIRELSIELKIKREKARKVIELRRERFEEQLKLKRGELEYRQKEL